MRLLLAMLLVAACAVAQRAQRVELVVSGPCVKAIKPGRNFECKGPDKDHMTCRGILVSYESSCAQIHVVSDGLD